MSGQRDVSYYSAPIYGLPGFGLDALPKGQAGLKAVIAAKSGDFTSDIIAHGTNGFEVVCTFADGATACQVAVLDADDSDAELASYAMKPGVTKFFTFYDLRLQVSAHPNLKFSVSDIAGGGTVAVGIRATA